MCAGLEMLLRNGVKVNMYLYQDVSEHSKRVAKVRCAEMVRRYPAQLNEERSAVIITPESVEKIVFPHIAQIMGQPVSFDAAQLGSYAHRLRAYWSNLHDKAQFDYLMKGVERPPNRWVTDVIGEGWDPREVWNSDRFPSYRCNVVGKPMMALPTIMTTQFSHAFRGDRAGTVMGKDDTGFIREVDLDKKSRAMGYSANVLRRSGLSDVELQAILGLAMDRRAMEALYAVSEEPWAKEAQPIHGGTAEEDLAVRAVEAVTIRSTGADNVRES
ncbi:hypothetical protein CYMTET_5787 [Cymbomonas tetramitiformis]|uniref:Uncharacterized protein n=1 Tax=Cymbomonas tetramitiformis TaxID=36881 RepID=A0AAE0GYX7_9CHLO|nr:hypothetical protein CYMTET_5787 [Cymbomonas tetramitiformis]